MNPLDTSDIENLLRGVHERIKEQKQQEKKNQPKPEPIYKTVDPVNHEEPPAEQPLVLVLDVDGIWRLR